MQDYKWEHSDSTGSRRSLESRGSSGMCCVATIKISADWAKMENFASANISCIHYGTLELVDPQYTSSA